MSVNKTSKEAYDLPYKIDKLTKIEKLEVMLFGSRNVSFHEGLRITSYTYNKINYIVDISFI